MSDTPRRLRRSPLGGGPPPPESLVRSGVIPDVPPVEIGAGGEVEGGTSNPAASASTARTKYRDEASPPKPQTQLINAKVPFDNLRK